MSQDVYLKSDLLNHIQSLLPSGFTVFDGDEFKRAGTNYDAWITFNYEEYYPHSARFNGVGLRYRFHQVEQIFTTIFSNFADNSNLPFGNLSIFETYHVSFGRNFLGETAYFELCRNDVSDDQSFAQVKPVLKYSVNAALEFEDQHNMLSDVYSFVESKGSQYWQHYREPAPGLRAIVRKILGLDYTTDLINDINRQTQSGKTVLASFHQEIKNYLDNM